MSHVGSCYFFLLIMELGYGAIVPFQVSILTYRNLGSIALLPLTYRNLGFCGSSNIVPLAYGN